MVDSVLAINRYGSRHLAPFLTSLSIEYLSYSLRKASLDEPRPGTKRPRFLSELEKTELLARQRAFWRYFLRGPLWGLWTEPKLTRLASRLERKPLLNILATLIQDYVPLIGQPYLVFSSYKT